MNFMKYTFTGRFFFYASIALLITVVMMVLLALMNITTGVIIAFSVFITFLLASIVARYFAWLRYKEMQRTGTIMRDIHKYCNRIN